MRPDLPRNGLPRDDLPKNVDRAAAVAALLVVADVALYLVLASGPDQEGAVAWVVVLLVLLAVLTGYAATRRRGHLPTLLVAGVLLGAVGLLAMFSIGLPLLVAAALCFWSALWSSRAGAAAEPSAPAPESSADTA